MSLKVYVIVGTREGYDEFDWEITAVTLSEETAEKELVRLREKEEKTQKVKSLLGKAYGEYCKTHPAPRPWDPVGDVSLEKRNELFIQRVKEHHLKWHEKYCQLVIEQGETPLPVEDALDMRCIGYAPTKTEYTVVEKDLT